MEGTDDEYNEVEVEKPIQKLRCKLKYLLRKRLLSQRFEKSLWTSSNQIKVLIPMDQSEVDQDPKPSAQKYILDDVKAVKVQVGLVRSVKDLNSSKEQKLQSKILRENIGISQQQSLTGEVERLICLMVVAEESRKGPHGRAENGTPENISSLIKMLLTQSVLMLLRSRSLTESILKGGNGSDLQNKNGSFMGTEIEVKQTNFESRISRQGSVD